MGIHFANSHGGCWFLHEGGIGYQKKVGITVSCSAQKYTIALIFSEMAACSVMTFVLIVL